MADEINITVEEDALDINSIRDPNEENEVDWDAIHDNEDGDTPNLEVVLSEKDFSPPVESNDVLENVRRIVALHKQKGLGGHLVASEMKRYTVLSVEELEERLKASDGR